MLLFNAHEIITLTRLNKYLFTKGSLEEKRTITKNLQFFLNLIILS